jgi:hypothetical protein
MTGGRFACVVVGHAENSASHAWPAPLRFAMTLLDAAGRRRRRLSD